MVAVTPWFGPHNPPVRSGVYQVRGHSRDWFAWWDNELFFWGLVATTPAAAQGMRGRISQRQDYTWRGVLK
jgi:hypothetical protein